MDNNVEVINVAYDKWILRASEGSWGLRLCEKADETTRRRLWLRLHVIGRAKLLISTQGYNDVSTVATIHHPEQPRESSDPGELSTESPERGPPSWGVYLHVCMCLYFRSSHQVRLSS